MTLSNSDFELLSRFIDEIKLRIDERIDQIVDQNNYILELLEDAQVEETGNPESIDQTLQDTHIVE